MPNQALWHCIQAVASSLRNINEETIEGLEADLRMMGPNQKRELRNDFRDVIAGLTMLEMRLAEEHE
jgi:hypothetical protein